MMFSRAFAILLAELLSLHLASAEHKFLRGPSWIAANPSTASLPADAWQTVPPAAPWDEPLTEYPAQFKRPALLVIEAQENYRQQYGQEMISEMQRLVDTFRENCLPIIFKVWPWMHTKPTLHPHPTKTCAPAIPMPELAPSTESEINRTVKYKAYDHFFKNPHLTELLESWDVDHVVIAGGYSEFCIIATASAAYSHNLGVVIAASTVGPKNASVEQDGKVVPSDASSPQHEAAMIAMRASSAVIFPTTESIVAHYKANGITGSVCPNTRVDRPSADYMRYAFPKDQKAYCNSSFPAIDGGMVGAWPLWAPFEARNLTEALMYRNTIPMD